jgi:hypothetical protein
MRDFLRVFGSLLILASSSAIAQSCSITLQDFQSKHSVALSKTTGDA